jgi:uncharacterized protein (TIGR02246 family)
MGLRYQSSRHPMEAADATAANATANHVRVIIKEILMTNDESAIRDLIETWCRATEAGNLDAILPLMAEDMLFLTPGQEPFGKRQFAAGFRQSAGQAKVAVRADVQEIGVSGDLAYCRLKLKVTVTPAKGEPVEHGGYTIGIYRREAGRWLLARDANLVI